MSPGSRPPGPVCLRLCEVYSPCSTVEATTFAMASATT